MPLARSALLSALLTLAATSAAAKGPAAVAEAPPVPPLWRISDEDSSVYLFGAIGLPPDGETWRSRDVARAIDASETIWLEAPVDEPAAMAAANRIFTLEGMAPEGATLSSRLPEAEREKLEEVSAASGLSIDALNPLKPWAAFVVLSARTQPESDKPSVEAAILAEARGRGRQLRYFNTIEESLRVLTEMPADMQTALAVHFIGDFVRQREEARAGFAAWRSGDLDAVDDYLNRPMRESAPKVYDRLIAGRVEALATGVAAALNGPETSFISLNASYVVGPGSLPERLAEMGLSVERIGAPSPD